MFAIKLTGIGTGVGMVLPMEALTKLKLSKGDSLWLIETPDGYRLTPHHPTHVKQMDIAHDVMRSMREALQEMSK